MSKISIVYWSGTGNTQLMAEAVKEGIKDSGKDAVLLTVDQANLDDLKEADAFALGCPSMGDEVLEEMEMEPFVAEVETFANGKKIALFGSYGWGDGQWMRDWVERMTKAGANVIGEEGVICQDAPGDEGLELCKALGKKLAKQ